METDVLGAPYERQVIDLGSDAEGPVHATLVRRRAETPNGTAVLYVHGFIDYFFQTHLADFFVERGVDFYALDLRKYGRSLEKHHSPNYCTDLTEYYPEIDEAVRVIREDDGHDRLIVNGHSTGGLITALWAHDRRGTGVLDALVLNSAYFDLNAGWVTREVTARVNHAIAGRLPKNKLPFKLSPIYGNSIHASQRGEWDYDLAWKPLAGFPIYAGWARAVRAGQRRVHAGLDIAAPVLSACSTVSYKGTQWRDAAASADTVLDVEHIARWSANLGRLVTIARIPGGLHDLALSAEPSRNRYFDEIDRWLTAYT